MLKRMRISTKSLFIFIRRIYFDLMCVFVSFSFPFDILWAHFHRETSNNQSSERIYFISFNNIRYSISHKCNFSSELIIKCFPVVFVFRCALMNESCIDIYMKICATNSITITIIIKNRNRNSLILISKYNLPFKKFHSEIPQHRCCCQQYYHH